MERRPLPQTLVGGLIGGAISGAAAGAIDVLWTWARLEQFLADWVAKLRLLAYVGALYALPAALIGGLAALILVFYARATPLGPWLRGWRRRQRAEIDRDPRAALGPLALAVSAPLTAAASLALLYLWLPWQLRNTHGLQLQLGVGIAATVGALLLAALLALALAAAVQPLLRLIAGKPRAARVLTADHAVLVGLGGMLAILGLAGVWLFWSTIEVLHLRPLWVALAALLLSAPAYRIGLAASMQLARRRRWLRIAAPLAGVALLVAVVLLGGASAGVRKSADRHSGIGGRLTRLAQRAGDFDGDGYSR
ncbi:MAG TPA: hypothetical protein VL172_05600, partial [Kofleriaceae bacterium]|nr:hypothetical protein [Kofleriaceae bacterium]